MPRYFDVLITSGTSVGPYTVYWNTVNANNIATASATSTPATNLTYGALSAGTGVNVTFPDSATSLILYNQLCLTSRSYFIPTPTPTPTTTNTPTPTFTPTFTPTPSITPTFTPTPTLTPTKTPPASVTLSVYGRMEATVNSPTDSARIQYQINTTAGTWLTVGTVSPLTTTCPGTATGTVTCYQGDTVYVRVVRGSNTSQNIQYGYTPNSSTCPGSGTSCGAVGYVMSANANTAYTMKVSAGNLVNCTP